MPADILSTAIAAGAGLAGVTIGAYLTGRNQKRERQCKRISEQLSGFYGPMLALRTQMLSQSELGQKISSEAGEAWQEMVKRVYEGSNDFMKIDRVERLTQQRWPAFEKLTDYGNRQLVEEIIPSYRKMIELFTSRLHLAEPSTIAHFPALLEFVEVWNRWLNEALPVEVLGLMNHTEEAIMPFYDDLLANFTRMQRELSERRRWWGWWRPSTIKVRGGIIAVNPFAAPRSAKKETPE